jgi:hypothetical protein
MAERQDPPKETDLSRRDFMRGAAATGLVVVGGGYVKPALKLAGTANLASTTSRPIRPKHDGEDDDHEDEKDQQGQHD